MMSQIRQTREVQEEPTKTTITSFSTEEEDLEDDDVMVPSFNRAFADVRNETDHGQRRRNFGKEWRSRGRREAGEAHIRSEYHVVYKRKDSHLDHASDYSQYFKSHL